MSPQNLLAHSFQPPQGGHHGFQESDLSSLYFLKRSKIDISQNVKFLSGYFDRSRSDQEGMPIPRFVTRHVRVIRGGLFLGVAG